MIKFILLLLWIFSLFVVMVLYKSALRICIDYCKRGGRLKVKHLPNCKWAILLDIN